MSKILAIADIHINDYANRNPSNRYRLLQTRTVAKNIIEAGKKEGCDIIVLAGDIVEKSIVRPYIQAEVKLFLDTLMSNFKEGYIIWGNHDLDGKSMNQEISDACLGVMLPPNLHYANKQIIKVDDTIIGFCNWMPTFDLTWIQNKVNILFTHATICYSKTAEEGRLFESQELDENKFDLAICGDIHKKGSIGKYVSIGCCQRCKLGDQEEATGVVVDCITHNWKWVNLNPHDNLLKFDITTVLEDEGWNSTNNTWYVYKQPNSILDQSGKIKVDAWNEINELTENAIAKAGLQDVHQEVINNIANIDSGEVDFNFTLQHLHCENWRSLKSVDVDFSDNDKILVIGSNGSGKSSLLTAIKFALCDVGDTVGISSLKPFVTFGEKDCLTEITFLYQGNICKIQRGTSKYGLWINGEPLKYNEKRIFEKDVRDRFPFIKYLDTFFFDADKTSFLKSLRPERITEITSKFLKLNRIETYNETSKMLFDQVDKIASEWRVKEKETNKLLLYINEKLKNISLPSVPKEELINRKNEGLIIQKNHEAWINYHNNSIRLETQLQTCTEKLSELKKEVLRNPMEIQVEIDNLKQIIQNKQQSLVNLGNVRLEYSYKMKEYESLKTEGNNAWSEAKSIEVGKKCSKCGQIIKTTEAAEEHRKELLQKVEEIRVKINKITEELTSLSELKNNSDAEYNKINKEINDLNHSISLKISEINHINSVISDIDKYNNTIKELQLNLSNLGSVPQVDLPENFMNIMSELDTGITMWNLFEETEKDRRERSSELIQIQTQVEELDNRLTKLKNYMVLTGPTGVIFEEILTRLAKQFSNNVVVYKVIRKGKNSREHLTLTPFYNNSGNLVSIDLCSSGQRTLLDIDYMSKIIDRLGLLVLDEFFKNLDNDRLEEMLEILKGMNLGCLILTSHAESIPAFNNKTCITSLDSTGLTQFVFR